MFDNMYYVGLQNDSVLLITTSDGLMLIDAAMVRYGRCGVEQHSKSRIRSREHQVHSDQPWAQRSFRRRGTDQTGGTERARRGVGPRLGFHRDRTGSAVGPVRPLTKDLVLNDNDVIKLGDTSVKVHSTPGHASARWHSKFRRALGGKTTG